MSEVSPNEVSILVVSCDAYQDLWKPFFHCFFKYWPDCPFPINLGANNTSYPDPRVRSILIGADVDYSSNLLAMLNQIEQDWIILWIEDRVISAPVNTSRITNLINQAIIGEVAYLKLISSHPFAFINHSDETGEIPAGSKYRLCMTVALWNKNYLRQLIAPGETAWDLERFGSCRSANINAKFLSLSYSFKRNPPIFDTHLLIKGRIIRNAIKFLSNEQLLLELRNRKFQTINSYLYLIFYYLLKDCLAAATYYIRRLL